jgi:hypothetical protein
MPRLIFFIAVAAGLPVVLVGCGGSKPAWVKLPSASGSSYQVSIRTYKDEGYADQPFELRTTSKNGSGQGGQILSAEQCKNVKIAQTKENLFIFYDEIVLRGFSSTRYDASLPRPFLCDMQHPFCRDTLAGIMVAKGVVSKICSYS